MPAAAYDAVGVDSPTNPLDPTAGRRRARTWESAADGGRAKPVVFFYGAEFAPYAAAERWPLVLALSRFGTFSQLGLMQSSASAAFADLSTFTFWQAGLREQVRRPRSTWSATARSTRPAAGYTRLENPNARQAAAVSLYAASQTELRPARRGQPLGPQREQLLARRARRADPGPDRRPT